MVRGKGEGGREVLTARHVRGGNLNPHGTACLGGLPVGHGGQSNVDYLFRNSVCCV